MKHSNFLTSLSVFFFRYPTLFPRLAGWVILLGWIVPIVICSSNLDYQYCGVPPLRA